MKVIVLMSTYNGERFLKEQIESILNQKGAFQLDLVVRDDGSSDGTVNILEYYKNKKLLNWYSGENLGPALSFIDLLYNSKEYDYYAFADQDDFWQDDKLERGIKKIESIYNPCVYFSNASLVDENLNYLGRDVYKCSPKLDFYTLSCAGGILGCTMILNNQLVECIKKKSPPTKIVMHDFYISVLCKYLGGEILYDNYCSLKYRQHGNNVIGVAHGKSNIIINRFKFITRKKKISISNQSNELLKYNSDLNYKNWAESIAKYRNNLYRRILLSFSLKTRYVNLNMSLKMRLAILLGNR